MITMLQCWTSLFQRLFVRLVGSNDLLAILFYSFSLLFSFYDSLLEVVRFCTKFLDSFSQVLEYQWHLNPTFRFVAFIRRLTNDHNHDQISTVRTDQYSIIRIVTMGSMIPKIHRFPRKLKAHINRLFVGVWHFQVLFLIVLIDKHTVNESN